ncbi:hypothetical protein RCO28_23760 [Streptomyces sp. LHD-70]|uniref:hypothetical protein n=1 Tax=Streptomyces sp. LHD-70 TaxID=3072140 RepID=UPI00280F431E|nr:hypothetical protein [Streptomyces sp. LHD-70]MDQ8705490.1 hypothetical protein [Streptomyces sp. LHD-70]
MGATSLRSRAVGAVLLAAVTLTACGGSTDDGKALSPSPKTSPTPRPTPSPTPSLTAEDGHDIKACADADCEVLISEPVEVSFDGPGGKAALSVTEVGPDKVAYTVKSANGRSRGSASGPGQGCLTVLRENGSGNSCGRVGTAAPEAQPDAVVVQLAAGEDGTALLHLVSD